LKLCCCRRAFHPIAGDGRVLALKSSRFTLMPRKLASFWSADVNISFSWPTNNQRVWADHSASTRPPPRNNVTTAALLKQNLTKRRIQHASHHGVEDCCGS
jgi:hypothetical protein